MSASAKEKEQSEQSHFDAFHELLSDFPAGNVRRGKPPAPDFLVDTSSGVLGIELTSISNHRREKEELRRQAIQAGQDEYQRRNGPSAVVSFFWQEDAFPIGKKARHLGQELAVLIERLAPSAASAPRELEWLELKDAGLEDLFVKIRIALFPDMPTHWTSPEAGYLSSEIETVQKIVTQKEEKLANYRSACKEVWLLLVAEGVSMSRMVDIEKLSGEVVESSFDRVYLLDFFGSKSEKSHPDSARKFVHRLRIQTRGEQN